MYNRSLTFSAWKLPNVSLSKLKSFPVSQGEESGLEIDGPESFEQEQQPQAIARHGWCGNIPGGVWTTTAILVSAATIATIVGIVVATAMHRSNNDTGPTENVTSAPSVSSSDMDIPGNTQPFPVNSPPFAPPLLYLPPPMLLSRVRQYYMPIESIALFENSMAIVALVNIRGSLDVPGTLVVLCALDDSIRAVAARMTVPIPNVPSWQFSGVFAFSFLIYGDSNGEPLRFLFESSSGSVTELAGPDVRFQIDSSEGTYEEPCMFTA